MTENLTGDQFSKREASSIRDFMSVNKDESAIFDPMEQDPEYQILSSDKSSSSREEEDLGDQWDLPRIQSPTDVSLMTDRRAQQILLERDLSMSDPLTAPPPSLDLMYSGNLRMGSDFSIEKVLGETTASILTQAEAEASHLASSWDIETGLDEPHSILSCRICQLFVRTVDRLLDKSEQFVDHYLPLTEEEIENLKRAVEEVDDSVVADHQMQVCMARINNLSSKLRQRAYMMALSKLRLARRNTQESLYQLHETIGLIEQAQSGVELESSRRFSVSVQWADSNPAESPLPSKIEIPRAGSLVEPHAPRLPSVVEIPQSPVAQDSVIEIAEVPLAQSTMMEAPQVSIAEITPVSKLEMAPTPPPTPPPEEPELPPPPPSPPITPVEEPEMPPPPPPPPIIPVEEPEMPPPPPTPPLIPVEEPELPPPPPPPPLIPVEEPEIPPPPPPPPIIPIEKPKTPPPPPPPPIKPTVEPKIPPPPPPPPEKPPKIHRDVKNITLTEPGCEDEDLDADLLQEGCNPASEIETKTLATSRSVIHNLQGTYENLLENLKDLPPGLQSKLNQTYQHICELQSDFASAQHFGDLSGDVLSKSMEVMTEAQGSLDELMEYALENPDALVWLKDNLPPSAMEKVLKQGEEEERSDILKIQKAYDPKGCDEETSIHDRVLSSRKEPRRNENILKVQKEYEPKGCDEETPPEPTQTSTPEQKARENILEILEAYDPKDCEEAPPTSKEPGEEAPSSHIWEDAKEWKMFKMLQSYKPKFFEVAPSTNVEEEVAVVEPPSETEPEDRDILKIQAAYDPKGCDSEAPTDKEQTTSSSSPEMEGWNILKIQAAHEPKGCETEVPDIMEEEDSPSINLEVKDLLAIQKAYDPRGCDDEMPPTKGEKMVPPSSTQETKDWDIMKMVHSYTPKFSDETPSTKQKEEPVVSLPDQQEKKESSAQKIQELHDPKGCDGEAPILGDMEVSYSDSPVIGTRNILEIQKAYEPIDCNESGPRVTEEDIFPAGQWVVKDIVEIQKAYDPRDCTDDT